MKWNESCTVVSWRRSIRSICLHSVEYLFNVSLLHFNYVDGFVVKNVNRAIIWSNASKTCYIGFASKHFRKFEMSGTSSPPNKHWQFQPRGSRYIRCCQCLQYFYSCCWCCLWWWWWGGSGVDRSVTTRAGIINCAPADFSRCIYSPPTCQTYRCVG